MSKICPECGAKNIITDSRIGEEVCLNCGYVLEIKKAYLGKDWRSFSLEEENEKARTGMSLTYSLHDKGLATIISESNKDAYGRLLSSNQRILAYQLRKFDKKYKISGQEKTLAKGLQQIEKIIERIGFQRNFRAIKETASLIFHEAVRNGILKGRKKDEICAGSVCLAIKLHNIPRSFREVAEATGIGRRYVERGYRILLKNLNYRVGPTSYSNYTKKIANGLNIYGKTEEIACKIARLVERERMRYSKDPLGLAGASIYIASLLTGERRSQDEISKTSGVTAVTIRKRMKELEEKFLFEVEL